jgi:hypothetical protein
MGSFNVAVFARHATGHEHFSLLFLPYVAMSTASLLFASRRTTALVPNAALVILVGLSWWQASQEHEVRSQTYQAEQAERFAGTTDQTVIYLRPQGVSLVFLYTAERHVVGFPASTLEEARRQVAEYRRRFGEHDLTVQLFVVEGDEVPRWFRKLTPVGARDGFDFYLFAEP